MERPSSQAQTTGSDCWPPQIQARGSFRGEELGLNKETLFLRRFRLDRLRIEENTISPFIDNIKPPNPGEVLQAYSPQH